MAQVGTPVILLAGGLGTRLREHDPLRPKPLVPVLNRPFIAWLIESLERSGYSRFILSIGYLAEQFESYPWKKEFPNSSVELVREHAPLGTGGAVMEVLKAFPEIEQAWIVNGDTYLESGLPSVPPSTHDAAYLALPPGVVFDARPNLVVKGAQLLEVAEKETASLFDAGAIFLKRAALPHTAPPAPFSVHTLLAQAFARCAVGYQTVSGLCYDIGTPARIQRFERYLQTKRSPSTI